MDNWIVIAILGGLASNLENFLFRYILKDGEDSTVYSWFHEFFRLFFYGAVIVFSLKNFEIKNINAGIFPLIGLGLIEFLTIYTFMKMHSFSHLSISSIISRTRLIWVPIIAYFMFGEILTNFQYVGIAILFSGLFLVSSPKEIFFDKGIRYAFAFSFMVAFVNIFMKLSSNYAATPILLVFMALPSVILFPIFMKNAKSRIRSFLKTKLLLKVMAGLVNALSMFLLTKALSIGQVSIVTGIYQGMMITSVLAGIFIFKEKENIGKKLIGSFIVIVGVILLTYIQK